MQEECPVLRVQLGVKIGDGYREDKDGCKVFLNPGVTQDTEKTSGEMPATKWALNTRKESDNLRIRL
jgi:hypothetical protein